jgi:hypothetical protein
MKAATTGQVFGDPYFIINQCDKASPQNWWQRCVKSPGWLTLEGQGALAARSTSNTKPGDGEGSKQACRLRASAREGLSFSCRVASSQAHEYSIWLRLKEVEHVGGRRGHDFMARIPACRNTWAKGRSDGKMWSTRPGRGPGQGVHSDRISNS